MDMWNKCIYIALLLSCYNSTEPEDCAGVAGGSAVEDECGICDGDGTSCVEGVGDGPYYVVTIPVTGVTSLHIFSNSITGLEDGDEIGIFDQNGIINYNDCSNEIGELLVAAGVWDGDQNNIVSIGSADFCSIGGVQISGYVAGHPMIVRVFRPSENIEYSTVITFEPGSGIFGEILQNIIEISLVGR